MAIALAALLAPPAAAAQVVANPGAFAITVRGFTMRLGGRALTASGVPAVLTAAAQVAGDGVVAVPGGVKLPALSLALPGADSARLSFTTTTGVTGSVNPLTGAGGLVLEGYLTITDAAGVLGPACHDGDGTTPLDLALTTATTAPPPPAAPMTGIAYNPATAALGLVGDTFALPGAQDCNGYETTIDSDLGLPAPAGADSVVLAGSFDPAVQPAVRPALAATPASGAVPLTVKLDAGASRATAGIASFAFDATGSGTFGPAGGTRSLRFTYTRPGTYRAAVRVTDAEGDSAVATRLIVVTPPPRRVEIALPSSRGCIARRLTIGLAAPPSARLLSAVVDVNRRRVLTRPHPGSVLVVARLPKGRFTLRVRVRTSSGATLTRSRVYRRCGS